MNSYFASVEQQANPLLRGRPVGVCEHLGGIIIAPSVEAKRAGIKLGTPVWEAIPRCPAIVLLPTDPDKYRSVTERFNRILRDYADEIERYSIDESFADITEYCGGSWDNALLLGLTIKQRMRREVGEWVSCSIGIGPNKLVAKVAADLGEGDIDRICVIKPEDIASLYDRLSLTDIPGIGKRLEKSLHKLGIFTLRQLAAYPIANLLNRFGVWGWVLKQFALFDVIASDSEAIPLEMRLPRPEYRPRNDENIKSIGHAYTLPRIIRQPREIKGLMMKLSEKVGRRMRRIGARGNVMSYFHSDREYASFHQQKKLGDFISGSAEIYKAAWGIFYSSPNHRPIKIMGITMSGLVFDKTPEPLWAHFQKPLWATAAADKINDKYGDWTVYPGRLLGVPEEWGRDTVGFGRMKI